jgi:hypothetical protein
MAAITGVTRQHLGMGPAVFTRDYDFHGIGERDAAIAALIFLDAYREQATVVCLLPPIYIVIKRTHRRIFEESEVMFVCV